jgi:uncharacterized protein (TIGR03663 family)
LLSRGLFLAAIALAAALRLPALAARPMHADEAIHADKFGTLLEGGGYAYDPAEYHGPTLYYLTLLPAWLRGQRRYAEVDEVTLRSVPAVLGVALVALHLAARKVLGGAGAVLAALLAAVSPAMVYYSRYFIHETALVFFSFGALLAAGRYLRAPAAGPALVGGACAGLMLATKETAVLALACMAPAFAVALRARRGTAADGPRVGVANVGRHLMLAALAAAIVWAAIFSALLTRPQGMVDALRAYGNYLDRARTASWHIHPWTYYLALLVHFPADGTPYWTEGAILLLSLAGAVAAWRPAATGADAAALRFLAVYGFLLATVYSSIPYKTPWCLLGFLHAAILLAGAGGAFLLRALPRGAPRALGVALLAGAAGHLAWQAFVGSFRLAADPRNPYVYAHTSADVFEIAARVRDLARPRADGTAVPVQIISGENLWPLPFYLRGLPGIEWWTGVSESAPTAPVVVLTPDMEPALVRKLYDLPPPGQRELYVSIFEHPVSLRPGLELRGFAANGLWDEYRRAQAEPEASAPGPRR